MSINEEKVKAVAQKEMDFVREWWDRTLEANKVNMVKEEISDFEIHRKLMLGDIQIGKTLVIKRIFKDGKLRIEWEEV